MAEVPIFSGFDPEWDSITDYVLGCTWDLWEGRGLAGMDRLVSDTLIDRAAGRVAQGRSQLRLDILNTLGMAPDLECLAEDVIWCPTDATSDTPEGVFASHRAMMIGTHTGASIYGAPTGSPLHYRVMTDGWYAENQLCDRWALTDTGAIVRQIGQTPQGWVSEMLDSGGLPMPLTPDSDRDGPYFGRGDMATPSAELEAILNEIMIGDMSVFQRSYDRACEVNHSSARTGRGLRQAEQLWLTLRNAFPSASFRIEHSTGTTEENDLPKASIRWSLYGKHDGHGYFGPPSGSFVYVMGITQADFGPRGIRREWTLIDECAIWAQILGSPG